MHEIKVVRHSDAAAAITDAAAHAQTATRVSSGIRPQVLPEHVTTFRLGPGTERRHEQHDQRAGYR